MEPVATDKPLQPLQLVECPRDAMQGWKNLIPAAKKIDYLNALLRVGFDTLDFGSFVSPRAIPQMADTAEVVSKLKIPSDGDGRSTRLLAIIANERGAEEAAAFDQISDLGFPFSVSGVFQQRNTNSSIEESLKRVEKIQAICSRKNKRLVIYISMAFGNTYNDPWSPEIVFGWVGKLIRIADIRVISLADTVGLALPDQVFEMTDYLIKALPGRTVGVHLHSRPDGWKAKIEAALRAGCSRFDGALKGIGGCPMAGDELVGNMDSLLLIDYFKKRRLLTPLNEEALSESLALAADIFLND
ncbi:MAG TPA: hypothetical protein VG890_04030 [Puia sp.]|nr:hypothetical protein [Puia sp.]